ncbi:MAG TPA: hypothetical protein VGD04_03480 [Methylophilus sp.]
MTLPRPHQSKSTLPWLWPVLVATLAVTVWTSANDDVNETEADGLLETQSEAQAPQPVARRNRQAVATDTNMRLLTADTSQQLAVLAQRNYPAAAVVDVFKEHTWEVIAPTVASKPEPAPPPMAPPAPYTYMGKLEESAQVTYYFLIANNKTYAVKLGEVLDSQWRLEREDSQRLYLTYLPLDLPQTLAKNAKQIAPVPPEFAPAAATE